MHRGLPQARAFTAKATCCSASFLLTVLAAIASAGSYSGGSGTEAEPFRISAVSDWQELMATPADWASHFVLAGDIDLNDVPITPVGNLSIAFTGVFDGNDYVIRNADVNIPGIDYVGLFGSLGTVGQIRNLGVEDASIFGRYSVGGLVGANWGGTISNCYSTGSVEGTGWAIGGLVGINIGTITNCYSSGTVSGAHWAFGGLVGCNEGTISSCYSSGSVSGDSTVGGLVGYGGGVVNSFWDIQTSDCNTSAGGTGKTTAEMKAQSTFTSAGWDFIEVWDIGENQTYPFLRTYLAGDINHDGVVDFRDITHLAADWLSGVE